MLGTLRRVQENGFVAQLCSRISVASVRSLLFQTSKDIQAGSSGPGVSRLSCLSHPTSYISLQHQLLRTYNLTTDNTISTDDTVLTYDCETC